MKTALAVALLAVVGCAGREGAGGPGDTTPWVFELCSTGDVCCVGQLDLGETDPPDADSIKGFSGHWSCDSWTGSVSGRTQRFASVAHIDLTGDKEVAIDGIFSDRAFYGRAAVDHSVTVATAFRQ